MKFSFLNPTGGLRYHLRGIFQTKSLWKKYIENIGHWLDDWKTSSKTLVIIGPSAGYSLSDKFLARFETIHFFELDPLAEFFFKKRHHLPNTKLLWHKTDFLKILEETNYDRKTVFEKFSIPSDAAVLYANILGQLKHILTWKGQSESSYPTLLHSLAKFNEGANWASFHDRISTTLHPLSDKSHKRENRMNSEEFIKTYFNSSMKGELWDHDLDILFNEKRFFEYHLWPVTKKQFHIIECWKSDNIE